MHVCVYVFSFRDRGGTGRREGGDCLDKGARRQRHQQQPLSREHMGFKGEKKIKKTITNEVFSSSAPYLWKRFGMVSAPPEARRGTMGWRMFWGRGGGGYDLSRDLGQGEGGGA